MSESEQIGFQFKHDSGSFGEMLATAEEGATRIWTIIGDGPPEVGKTVQVAESVLVSDGKGHTFYQLTGEFRDVTIVDNSKDA